MRKNFSRFVAMLMVVAICMSFSVTAFAAASSFTDVPSNFWAVEYIEEMSGKGIVEGFGNGIFKPNDNVSGAQFSTMMSRAFFEDTIPASPAGFSMAR